MSKLLSVAVIGAGPAGMSAALWLKQLGMRPVLIEKTAQAGGMQRFNFLRNDWVLGQQQQTGIEMSERFFRHIDAEEIECHFESAITAIHCQADGIDLQFEQQGNLLQSSCQALIVAAGTRFLGAEVLPDVGGNQHYQKQKIIEGPYAFQDIERVSNQCVTILGAGDNAFENADLLLKQGCEVILLARSKPSAQKKFVEPVMANAAFTLYESVVISAVDLSAQRVSLSITSNGSVHSIQADALHVLAGYQSNAHTLLPFINDEVACDDDHFIVVDASGRTNVKHVYAAGDVCNPAFPSVVSAMASGALAAKTISRDY